MIIGMDTRSASWYRGTGIGTYSYELIRSVLKIDPHNLYNLYTPTNNLIPEFEKTNTKVYNLYHDKSNNFWESINNNLYSLTGKEDLFHTHQNGIGLPMSKTCKNVITLHDLIPLKMPETVSESYMKIFNSEMPKIIDKCDGIITVSNYSKKDIIECFNFPEDKIFVTYLATDKTYHPIDKALCKELMKRIYNLTGKFILYIGGFSPRKNILNLINAFSKLNDPHNEYKLIIAGTKGISYSIYKNRVDELNLSETVLFPGYIEIDHLPYLYNASELFVYPSFYEGFGLPPIEAMSCGVPVIASNVTSIPEIVGDAALFVNPHDIDDIFEKIETALYDDSIRNLLIDKGFNRVKSLSWDFTAQETLKSYEKIYNS